MNNMTSVQNLVEYLPGPSNMNSTGLQYRQPPQHMSSFMLPRLSATTGFPVFGANGGGAGEARIKMPPKRQTDSINTLNRFMMENPQILQDLKENNNYDSSISETDEINESVNE